VSRATKSLKLKAGHKHREHRSKKGRMKIKGKINFPHREKLKQT